MISRRHVLIAGMVTTVVPITPLGRQSAVAQDYPRRTIQIIVPANAGGPSDVGARILASIVEKDLGQSVVVANKAGAGSQIGLTEFARSRPDGYTLGLIPLPGVNTIVLDPERKAAFGVESIIPVINQVFDAGVIWVKADGPYKTLDDLVATARQNPGKLSACTTGILSDDHLAILMLQEAAKVDFRIVHFDGAAQQLTAILGGHVDVAFDNVGSVRKRAQAGEVRVLAVMNPERVRLMPDVPSSTELGYPTVVSSSTRGIGVPKGTPPAVIKVIETSFRRAMSSPDHIQRMEDAGLEVRIMTGAEYASYYADQHIKAKKYTEWALKMRQ
jgi:tripartite-type tricarboxylate transporter receptor subunit TctC